MAQQYESLDALSQACLSCTACDLSKQRTHVVPGEGNEKAQVMFIGEGPGYNEDQQGRPFVGQAGKLLDELIASIGMKRSDVFIANVVKCRPPGNRDPMPAEIAACSDWLNEQIRLINPKVIVTLGRYSMAKFMPGDSISKVHGSPRKIGERVVLPVHHPAAALYQQSLKQTLQADFKKIPQLLKEAAKIEEAKPEPKQLGLF